MFNSNLNLNKTANLCKEKEQELLDKYFGNLVHEAAIERPETIGEYTKGLPLKIEAEYCEFLEGLWEQYVLSELHGTPLVLEEQKLRKLMTDDDREGIGAAYMDAYTITLWEKITKSNHEDVTYYKGLLLEYAKNLLMIMRIDFFEEIIGEHINCKVFEV